MLRYLVAGILLCSCVSASVAGEVANLFSKSNKDVDRQSREASAAALQGVQTIILGLINSELRQLDARKDNLSKASDMLVGGANKMKAIVISDDMNLPLDVSRIPENDRIYLKYVRETYLGAKDFPRDVKEAYGDFIILTTKLAGIIASAATSNDEVLPREVIDATARYLVIGGILSRAIATTYAPANK